MEKNPLQHTHQYPWAKINKTEIISQYPNHTMVIDNGEGDRDIRTWEKITELCSNVFATDREMISNPLQFKSRCREMTSNPLHSSIWWSNEMWEGSEKGGKILAEIFWGNWEREMVFALEFATVISKQVWADMTIHKLWAPRGQAFYILAAELCNSEKHQFGVSSFHHSHSNQIEFEWWKQGEEIKPNTQNCVGPT